MSLRAIILQESHKHNLVGSTHSSPGTTQPVKHSSSVSLGPALVKSTTLKSNISSARIRSDHLSMDGALLPFENRDAFHPSSAAFISPLRTLAQSLEDPERIGISVHDLVEAYNVLATRVRSKQEELSGHQPPSFLSVFTECSSQIATCLSRDIRIVLPSPFESFSDHGNSSMNLSYHAYHVLDDEDLQDAKDDSLLCQFALRFLCDLFRIPALYSIFPENQLALLFQDAVSLCTLDTSRTIDSEKLCSLALWTVKVQHLPSSTLKSEINFITTALKNALVFDVGGLAGKVDAFQATESMLRRHSLFIHPFLELLPPILDHLTTERLDVRLHAAFALTAFALPKLNAEFAAHFPHKEIAECVQDYINSQTSKRKTPVSDRPLLPAVLKSALDGRTYWEGKGPSFAITLTSVLILLLDYHVFENPRSVRLIFAPITEAGRNQWQHVGAHPEMWKILLWAFSRIPRKVENESGDGALATMNDTRERTFLVLKQEVGKGIGIALVRLLLHLEPRDRKDVRRAIGIVSDLLGAERDEDRQDGARLLDTLMSGIGTSESAREKAQEVTFTRYLVDGALLGISWSDLVVPSTASPVEDIHPLSESEVVENWDNLSQSWILIVQRLLLQPENDAPTNIFNVWQALLLVQSELNSSHEHLTTSQSFSSRVTSIIVGFMFTTPLDTAHLQVRYLYTITKLWNVLKNIFTTSWLSSPAERVLASLLKKQFDLGNETIKDLWSHLCADLISAGIPTLLHVLHTRSMSESQEEKEVTRTLWSLLAQNPDRIDCGHGDEETEREPEWMDLVHLLAMPFGAWDMDDAEVEIWEETLARAIELAAKDSHSSSDVVAILSNLLRESQLLSLERMQKVLFGMVSHLTFGSERRALLKLLSPLNSVLLSLYSEGDGKKIEGLVALRLMGKFIQKALGAEVAELLSVTKISIAKWISDEDFILSGDERMGLVNTLYTVSLVKLTDVEPSLSFLEEFAEFLQSGFTAAPSVFLKFWRSTYYKRKDISTKDYPMAIRSCLKSWSDIRGDSIADDVSLASESQSLESYTIPDSQPSPEKASSDIDLSIFEEVSFDSGIGFSKTSPKNISFASTSQMLLSPFGHPDAESTARPSGTLFPLQRYRNSFSNIHDLHCQPGPSRLISPLKRTAEMDSPHTPKRRRTEPDFIPRRGKERAREYHAEPTMFEPSPHRESLSEPVTRNASLLLQHHPASQPFKEGRKRRQDETPSWVGSDLKRLRGVAPVEEDHTVRGIPSSDDFDSWEQAHLEEPDEDDEGGEIRNMQASSPSLQPMLSPSLGESRLRSRRRERSQTAPEPSTALESESVSLPQPDQSLRRHRSSPLEQFQRKQPAQLHCLQDVAAMIEDTGVSQLDMEDILRSLGVANRIQQSLGKQLTSKFGSYDKGT